MNLKELNGYSLKVLIGTIILVTVALVTTTQFIHKKLRSGGRGSED
jgi:hypothetical protein